MYCCGPDHDFAQWQFPHLCLRRSCSALFGVSRLSGQSRHEYHGEDKIIRRVREQSTTLAQYTAKYSDALEDLKTLNCDTPHPPKPPIILK